MTSWIVSSPMAEISEPNVLRTVICKVNGKDVKTFHIISTHQKIEPTWKDARTLKDYSVKTISPVMPEEGYISIDSPVGSLLFSAKAGRLVEYKKMTYHIIDNSRSRMRIEKLHTASAPQVKENIEAASDKRSAGAFRTAKEEKEEEISVPDEEWLRDIQATLHKRDISSLYHFTNVKNIPSIIRHGIFSKNTLEKKKSIQYKYNDDTRADMRLDRICTSVGWPSWSMLYSISKKEPKETFAIIEIDIKILLRKDYRRPLFYVFNAASRHSNQVLCGQSRAFEAMFEDSIHVITNARGGETIVRKRETHKNWPTSSQAEVLLDERVWTRYIRAIHFQKPEDIKPLDTRSDLYKVSPRLFQRRGDGQ